MKITHLIVNSLRSEKSYRNIKTTSELSKNFAEAHNASDTTHTGEISTPIGESNVDFRPSVSHQKILNELDKVRQQSHAKSDQAKEEIYPELSNQLEKLSDNVNQALQEKDGF